MDQEIRISCAWKISQDYVRKISLELRQRVTLNLR